MSLFWRYEFLNKLPRENFIQCTRYMLLGRQCKQEKAKSSGSFAHYQLDAENKTELGKLKMIEGDGEAWNETDDYIWEADVNDSGRMIKPFTNIDILNNTSNN